MARVMLSKLLERVKSEIKNAERILKESKDAANELNHVAAASPSTSGDREHAINAAYINEEKVVKLLALRKEIKEALDKEAPDKVEPVCYFNNYYLVSKPLYLQGINMISQDSKLGKAVLGKKLGENYKFRNEHGQEISGTIDNIE